jgi:SAM-dependent MidA family methyltransferase
MKLFEKMVEAALTNSPLLLKMSNIIYELSIQLHESQEARLRIVQTLQVHQAALVDITQKHAAMIAAMREGAVDTRIPSKKKEKESKPN